MDATEFREYFPDIAEGVAAMIGSQTSSFQANEARLNRLEAVSGNAFRERLDSALGPEWRNLNANPAWSGFLSEKDRYGRTRLDLLNQALQEFNAEAIINLVNDFKSVKGSQPSASDQRTPRQPAGHPEQITRAFIARFYGDVVAGKYKFREKEKEAIQKKIDAAVAAGKVI